MTVVEAVAYVMSGMYGPVAEMGAANATLVILQLCFAGVLVLLWVRLADPVPVLLHELTCG
jgi:protein transport protein SEC61 subunit alpha